MFLKKKKTVLKVDYQLVRLYILEERFFLMLKYSVFFLHLNSIRCPVSTELFCCSHGNWYESGTLYVSHETTQTRSQVCDMAKN